MKTLREIYEKIVSCHAQMADLQYDLLGLNGEFFSTNTTKERMQPWMIDECARVQHELLKLSERFWELPEVNKEKV